jgi:hypothetical protein
MQYLQVRELAKYLRDYRPELARELQHQPLHRVRERLNEITGCNVDPSARLDEGCKVFLDALRNGRKKV